MKNIVLFYSFFVLLAYAWPAIGQVTVQVDFSPDSDCAACFQAQQLPENKYEQWQVKPRDTQGNFQSIGQIQFPFSKVSDPTYSEVICCTRIFSDTERTAISFKMDTISSIDLVFNRLALYGPSENLLAGAYDFAYAVGIYDVDNTEILWNYFEFNESDVASVTKIPDFESDFNATFLKPNLTDINGAYIILAYQVVSTHDNASVTFLSASVEVIVDNSARVKSAETVIALTVSILIPAVFLAIFLPIYFKIIKPRQQKKKEAKKGLEMANKSESGASTPVESKYGAISATASTSSGSNNYNLLSGGNYSPLGPMANTPAPVAAKSSGSKDLNDRFNIPYKEITFKKEIGAGGFGKVYMGEWQSTEVAIKVSNTIASYDEFRKEAELMVNIRPHPNVLQVLGVSTDGVSPAIIMEYCPGGSLDLLLFDAAQPLTAEYQFRLILGIARGMLHLHKNNIVHRDLAARNILLSRDGEPKISDFGMSRIIESTIKEGTTRTNIGPIRWMAPESVKNKKYSTKSDVWSFGIVLSEITNREEPHKEIEDVIEVAIAIRNENKTPAIKEDLPAIIKDVMRMCWAVNPDDRPEMDVICEKLIKYKDDNNL